MRKVAIYFNDTYLDLFGDEEITLIRKASDYRTPATVYTDFSQTFTVPASAKNNRTLKHYYDIGVLNGWGQSQAVDGWIEIDTMLIRQGSFIIEGCKYKNGMPSSYSLTFYGALKGLRDTFGDDRLSDLDLSAYDHAPTFANVETGVEGAGLGSSNVFYPLISPVRRWSYNSSTSNHDVNNIAYHSGHSSNEHGINYYELKPALRVARIIEAIETKYSLVFNSTFFGTAAFTDLFIWMHRNEGYLPQRAQPITVACTENIQHTWNDTTKVLTFDYAGTFGLYGISYLAGTTAATQFWVEVYLNGTLIISNYAGAPPYLGSFAVETGDEVTFRFRTLYQNVGANLKASIIFVDSVYVSGGGLQTIDFDTPQALTYSYVFAAEALPEMRIYDFFLGIMRMFNLIIYPNNGEFDIEPYDDWIAAGTSREIGRSIDVGEVDATKAQVYREIDFKYAEAGTVAAKLYRDTFGVGFGDLELNLDFNDAETFNVELPFEMLVWERLFDDDDNAPTEILAAYAVEDATTEPKPYIGKPFLFYYIDKPTSLTKSFNLLTAAGGDNQVTSYNRFGNANESSLSSNTLSLSFGADIDAFFGQSIPRGLYQEYYSDQINDIYDPRTRIFHVEAVLSLPVIIALEMNDTLTFGGNQYTIEEVQISLNTGRAKLKLINKL